MKYLILCEGNNERVLIDLLLDADKLKICRDELIGLTPFNVRQLTNPYMISQVKMYNEPVIVYRIGDTQREKLKISKEIRHLVSEENIYKYCTLPELEILLIINEGMYKDFLKSKMNPKSYAKSHIIYHKTRYDQSSSFLKCYYETRLDLLIENLKAYKHLKKHKNKDELYLIDLIK